MSKRALRRHHSRRMKAKARRFYPWAGERAIRWADYLCTCSCHMCRTPRRSGFAKGREEKLTRQELVSEHTLREGVLGLQQDRRAL